jgi:hypothetical protein
MKIIHISISRYLFILSILFFIVFVGSIEIILRLPIIKTNITVPTFGSEHRQFEIQLYRLKEFYESENYIDCIFVGDSLVWLDLDPIAFTQGFNRHNFEDFSCFNFGIAALSAFGVSRITEILINEYNPKLIIYGLHANSIVVPADHEDSSTVLDTSWVSYKYGEFNLLGWLYEHSYFARYSMVLNQILRFNTGALDNESGASANQILGFDPKQGQRININNPPSRNDPADQPGFEKYYDYKIYPENIQGINSIADADTSIIFVIMPVHQTFYYFFRDGEDDYNQISEILTSTIKNKNTILLKADEHVQFLDNDWWDYSHLNNIGAQKFSFWLGQEVGALLLSTQQ